MTGMAQPTGWSELIGRVNERKHRLWLFIDRVSHKMYWTCSCAGRYVPLGSAQDKPLELVIHEHRLHVDESFTESTA